MENKLKANKELILIVLGILGVCIVSHNNHQQYKEKNNDFDKFGMFTIGRVVEYSPKVNQQYSSTSPKIKFSYLVQGKYYLEESDYDVPNEDGPQIGSFFMAVYLPKYPQIGALLLDYPVKSAGDYNKYIKEFKNNRPKFDK